MRIELRDVKKIFKPGKNEKVIALRDFNLTIEQGDYISVCGVSGSGKSTLLHLIGCLDLATEGKVLIDGVDTKSLSESKRSRLRNEKIGFVFQDFALIPYRTVEENLRVPLYFSNIKYSEFKTRIDNALKEVDIFDLKKRRVSTLSGGQKQRVAIARALVMDTDIILADEPSGALDTENKQAIMTLFEKINKMNKTLIVVTHDRELADVAFKKIFIKDGAICEGV